MDSLRERPVLEGNVHVALIEIKGMIEPILASFLERQIERAVDDGAKLIIFEIDSPGGYLFESQELAQAIAALKERTGSSPQAIKAHIVANHPSIKFAQHLLRAALKKGAETGKFIKVKASFKLGAEEKKAKKVAVKKVAAAPAAAKKAPAKAAAPVKKSPVAKKGEKSE